MLQLNLCCRVIMYQLQYLQLKLLWYLARASSEGAEQTSGRQIYCNSNKSKV